ncbi:MAG: GNAT family N-acetyltransferase [Clostridia bacterium]|nr:GNAT family N-acetyltransferase [Clostridia bacterium]
MLLNSEQKNSIEIQNQLVMLWADVFGDSEDYIRLFLPYLSDFEVFAVFEKEKIVSCFYLLPSEILCNGKSYSGYYLYAAATKESCRGKGYMGGLIKEAINELREKADFISLVPADEGLYSYYSRFGFESVMYNYETVISCKGVCDSFKDGKALSGKEVNKLRKKHLNNAHLFSDETMDYALSCYGFSGSEFLQKGDISSLYVKDEKTAYELFSEAGTKEDYLSVIENNFEDRIKVISPFKLTEKSVKVKCGMVNAFPEVLKNEKEIYMNHTLM